MVETFMRQPLFDKLYSKRQAFISIACMRYVGDVLIKASLCESWVGPFWYMGLFFQASPVMYVVYITFQAGRPSRVGPYAGPGRGVFYELRVARSDVVSLSRSRRYAASESAKKAVARSSWFVARKSSPSFRMGCGQISQRAALRDGPYEPQTHSPRATSHELRTTKKALENSSAFLQESAASYPPRGPPPKYFRRLRA